MNVFNLFAKINLDTAEYKKNLKEVEDTSKTTAQKLEQDLSKTAERTVYTYESFSQKYTGITKKNKDFVQDLISDWNDGSISVEFFNESLEELGIKQKNVKVELKTFTDQVAELKKKWQQVETQNKTNLAMMKSLFNNGVISAKQYNEAVANAKARQQELLDNAKEIGIELPEDFNKAGEAMGEAATNAGGVWAKVADIILKIIGLMKQLINSAVEFSSEIYEIASAYGMTTEEASELKYIASQTGTSIDTITTAMTQMERKLVNGEDAFAELGVTIKDANGDYKSMTDIMFDTIGALEQLDDENEKSAYMVQLFGRTTMESGELFRMTADEIENLRQRSEELGITTSESTAEFGVGYKRQIEELKLQGQSALASMLAGEDDGEEKIQAFFDNLMSVAEKYAPTFISFALKVVTQFGITLAKIAPSLAFNVLEAIIDALFSINWFQVGIDWAKAILEGFLNIFVSTLNALFGWAGVDIPKVDLGGGKSISDYTDTDLNTEYEISENKTEEITIKLEASGDTAISQASAEETAKALAPYIDEILGAK